MTSNRAAALRQAVEAQQRFQAAQEARVRELLAAMRDAPASKLLDDPSDMQLLESASNQARLGFDTPLEADADDFWSSTHDRWFSPESSGDATQATGARPLEISDNRLEYSEANADQLQCMPTMGSQLCAFPSPGNPVLTVEPVGVQPIAPALPTTSSTGGTGITSGNQGITVQPPNLSRPVAPASPGEGGPPLLKGDTPQLLGKGAPDAPISPRSFDTQSPASSSLCEMAVAETGSGLVAGFRERVGRLKDDPNEQVDLLINFVNLGSGGKALPGLQGKIASVGRRTYRSFVDPVICGLRTMLTVAASDAVFGHGAGAAMSDQIIAWADRGLPASATKEILNAERDALLEMAKDRATDFLKFVWESVVSNPPGLGTDIPPYQPRYHSPPYRYREPAQNYPAEYRHWVRRSPKDHLLPTEDDRPTVMPQDFRP